MAESNSEKHSKNSSDEFEYSSEDELGPKSIFDVRKGGHIPGKHKRDPNAKKEEQISNVVREERGDEQESEKREERGDEQESEKREERGDEQESEKRRSVSSIIDSGIFGKSMVVISSPSEDDLANSSKKKTTPPPVPPKPVAAKPTSIQSVDTSLSSQVSDDAPTPKPRRIGQKLSMSGNDGNKPRPVPTPRNRHDVKKIEFMKEPSNVDDADNKSDENKNRPVVVEHDVGNKDLAIENDANGSERLKILDDTEFAVSDSIMIDVGRDVKVTAAVEKEDININSNIDEPSNNENVADKVDHATENKTDMSGNGDDTKVKVLNEYEFGVSDSLMPDIEKDKETEPHVRNTGNEMEKLETVDNDHIEQEKNDEEPEDDRKYADKQDFGTKNDAAVNDFDININIMNDNEYSVSDSIRVITSEDSKTSIIDQMHDPSEFDDGKETTEKPDNEATSSFAVIENVVPVDLEIINRHSLNASLGEDPKEPADLSDATESFKSIDSETSNEEEIFEDSSSEMKSQGDMYQKPNDNDSNKELDGDNAGPEKELKSSTDEMADTSKILNFEESIVVIQKGSFGDDVGHIGYKSINSDVTSDDIKSFSISEKTSCSSFDILSQSGTSDNFEEVFGDKETEVVKATDSCNYDAKAEKDPETVEIDVLKHQHNDDVKDIKDEQLNMDKTHVESFRSTKDSDECQQSVNDAAPPPIKPKSEAVLESLKSYLFEHEKEDSRHASQQMNATCEENTETQPSPPPRMPKSDAVLESIRDFQSTESETTNTEHSHQFDSQSNQTNYARRAFDGNTSDHAKHFGPAQHQPGMLQQMPYRQPLMYANGRYWPMYQPMPGNSGAFQHNQNVPFQQQQPYWPYQTGYTSQPIYDNINDMQRDTNINRPADRANSPYRTSEDVSSDKISKSISDPSMSRPTSTTKTPKDVSSDKVPKSETNLPNVKSSPPKKTPSRPIVKARKVKPKKLDKSTKELKQQTLPRSTMHKEFCIQFKGISNVTGPETITNIIEVVTGIETDSDKVVMDKSKECAWIILEKKPDLEKLKERIKKRGLDGSHPIVSEVPVSTIPSKEEKKKDPAKRENLKPEKAPATQEEEEKTGPQQSLIFLKGINPDMKEESLRNFVETATKGTLDKIIYNYSKTSTLVTVNGDTNPNLAKLRNKVIKTNGFEGCKPEIVEMPLPTSIAVSSLSNISSLEALGLYFESKRSNGDIILNEPYESKDGTCCIVEYGNHEVVRRVCEKHNHQIDQALLRVSPFYQCDVGEIWDAMLHTVTIPAAITIELGELKIKFLQKKCCEDLLTILGDMFCKVTFSNVSVQLECLITPKVEGFKGLAEVWQDNARDALHKYIEETVKEGTVKSNERVWEELMEYFIKEEFDNMDQLVASPCATSYKVEIVGLEESVNECSEKLELKHKEVEKRLNRIKSTIRKSALELEVIKKLKVLERIQDDVDDLSVEYDLDSVTIEAQPDDISTVKLRMVEFSNEIENRSWSHNWSTFSVQFILQKLIPNISNDFENKGIVLSWEICDAAVDFCVYKDSKSASPEMSEMGSSDEDNISDKVIEIFQNLFIEKQVTCDKDNVDLFRSNEWTSFIETVTETYEMSAELEVDVDKVLVYGLRSEVFQLKKEVEQFLKENSVFKSQIDCKAIELKFMDKHMPGFLSSLEKKYGSNKLHLLKKGNKIEVLATKEGLNRVQFELNKFQKSIVSEQHTVERVAVREVMRDEFDQGALDKIEKDTRCIIKLPDEDIKDTFEIVTHDDIRPRIGLESLGAARGYSYSGPKPETTPSEFKTVNGVTIKLVKGVLHEQDGDVMVVATAPNLNLSSGKACKSLLQAAGQELQDACKKKYPNDIGLGDIAVVHACGSLECNRVYFTTLPNWNNHKDPRSVLKKVMKDSLEMASKHKKHSIMFSAMGTGQLRYPTDTVAIVMFESVIEFDGNNAGTTLKDVKFVLFKKDQPTIKAFEDELKHRISGNIERPKYDYQIGPIKVQVVIENIAQQQVDAVFCTTSKSMDLTHGACQALLRSGGKSLQEECKTKYNNELDDGTIAEIGSGNLPCKCVLLTVLPHYGSDAMKLYLGVIKSMLQTCESKQLTSVAMPALGTGNLKYPKEEVCKTMFDAIDSWVKVNSSTCLRNVRFVMHAKDREVIQTFHSHVRTAQGRGQRKNRTSLNVSQAIIHSTENPMKIARYNAVDNSFTIGKIKLTVSIGDLLEQKTDVIVNTVGNDFDLIGGVSQALAKRCPSVVEESKKQDKLTKLQKKNIVRTGCNRLAAKWIFHVKYTEILHEWRGRLLLCLEKADRHKLKSMAFPLIGTGQAFKQFSPDDIAVCMFDAIDEYEKTARNLHVKDIRVIVFNRQPQQCEMIKRIFHRKIRESVNPPDVSLTGYLTRGFAGVQKWYHKFTRSDMKPDERNKIKKETSSMTLQIYSDKTENIKNCKTELEARLDRMYSKKIVNDYIELVKKLTQEEKDLLDIPALVNINIDSKTGIITVDGPSKLVDETRHEIQLKLLKVERARNEAENAKQLYGIAQWHYEEVMLDGTMKPKPYNQELNFKIEEAYKGNKPDIRFQTDGKTYVIDFKQLVEYDQDDDQDTVRVIRKDILKEFKGALPDDWTAMKDNQNLISVPLTPTDAKYKAIEQKFLQEVRSGTYAHRVQFSFDPNNLKVTKIERVQNKTLYQQYQAKKKQMSDQKPNLPQNMPIERDLWHGMKPDVIASIQNHGFNRSYSGDANGQPWYGDGVYFAGDASYSCRGWLTGAKPGTKTHVFLVNVLTGEFCKGTKGMRYLPVVNPAKPTVMYDSAVDDPAKPYEFVIFNDTQAYPAYLVTFSS